MQQIVALSGRRPRNKVQISVRFPATLQLIHGPFLHMLCFQRIAELCSSATSALGQQPLSHGQSLYLEAAKALYY